MHRTNINHILDLSKGQLNVLYFYTMKNIFIIAIGAILLSSCGASRNLNNAKDSLKGEWEVVKIYSAYGQRMQNGTSVSEEFNETGELGTFTFRETNGDYTFIRRDTTYTGSGSWALTREKVNQGFTQVEVYTLDFGDYTYVCEFGDQTSDAEQDATEIRLIYETTNIGYYETFMLEMEK